MLARKKTVYDQKDYERVLPGFVYTLSYIYTYIYPDFLVKTQHIYQRTSEQLETAAVAGVVAYWLKASLISTFRRL